jgi:hypothetical protein
MKKKKLIIYLFLTILVFQCFFTNKALLNCEALNLIYKTIYQANGVKYPLYAKLLIH